MFQDGYFKVIKTGNITELYQYEKLNTSGGGARDQSKRGDGKDKEYNYKNSQQSRRNHVRQLATNNFDNRSKFLTLTFNNQQDFDIRDVKQCNKHFKQFIQRMRYIYGNYFKYLAVIEFQDKNRDGVVHYHVIWDLPYIPIGEIEKIWRAGFCKINKIENVDNIGAYITKYMTKNLDDQRLCGLKAYQHSKNLVEPVIIKSWDKEKPFSVFSVMEELEKKSPSYTAMYESEYLGKVVYSQFNDNRKNSDLQEK